MITSLPDKVVGRDVSVGLAELNATNPHGAFTCQQAKAILGPDGLRAAVESGSLIGFSRHVLLDASRILDIRTRAAAALLLTEPTGVLVGPTATALHGCPVSAGFAVHVRVPYYQRVRGRPGMVVHQGRIDESAVLLVDGLRVQRLAAALAEVLCLATRRAALACVEQALRRLPEAQRPGLLASVEHAVAARPDRRGSTRASELLALATGRTESAEHSALLLTVVDGGFPVPMCQYQVGDRERRLAFAWPDAKIALEYGPVAETLDRELSRRGWLALSADRTDLAEPSVLFGRLRQAFARCRLAA